MKEYSLVRPDAVAANIMYMQSEGLRWYGGKNDHFALRVTIRCYPTYAASLHVVVLQQQPFRCWDLDQ